MESITGRVTVLHYTHMNCKPYQVAHIRVVVFNWNRPLYAGKSERAKRGEWLVRKLLSAPE